MHDLSEVTAVGDTTEDCPFCRMMAHEKDAVTFVTRTRMGALFLNRDQTFRGRCILMYGEHVEAPTAIDRERFKEFSGEAYDVSVVLLETLGAALVNYAILRNGVAHLHWHLIPRYEGDPNWGRPPWPHEYLYLSDASYQELARSLRARLLGRVTGVSEDKLP